MTPGVQPTAAQVARYQELYRRYGIEITEQQAREEGAALMQLVSLIYKPLTKNEYAKYDPKLN